MNKNIKGSNAYGTIVKNTDDTKSCCDLCKYGKKQTITGLKVIDPCWSCASEEIDLDCYYEPDKDVDFQHPRDMLC